MERQRWLSQYPFERFVTLTFPGERNMKYVAKQLAVWRTALIEQECLQIGYIGVVYFTDTQTHIHLLMLGKNRFGKTLSDVSCCKWEREWGHGMASMEAIKNAVGADYYIQNHMTTSNPDAWEPLIFNRQLLKQLRHRET